MNEVTNSYNSYKPAKAILAVLRDAAHPISPFTITQKTGKNPNTIRVYLRRLLKEGKVIQPARGLYSNADVHGVSGGLPPMRVHNICCVGITPFVRRKMAKVVEWNGDVKLEVIFGVTRHQITLNVNGGDNPDFKGMDYSTVVFALNRCFDIVFESTGHSFPDSFLVKTFEVNRDFDRVRLDGATCFTRKSLFGVLERIYDKGDGVVRVEQKVSRAMQPMELLALMQGGVSFYNMQQMTFMLLQQNERISAALKFSNEKLAQVGRLLEQLLAKR